VGKRDRTQDEKYNKEWEREIENKMKNNDAEMSQTFKSAFFKKIQKYIF
jgi:hypothetical protein